MPRAKAGGRPGERSRAGEDFRALDAWWRDRSVRLVVGPPLADLKGNAMAAPYETLFLPSGQGGLSGGFLHGEAFDEVPLTGDTYPVSGADRRREHLHHRAPGRRPARPGLVVALVVIGVALLAALGYVAWRLIWGPPIPALSTFLGTSPASDSGESPAAVQPAPMHIRPPCNWICLSSGMSRMETTLAACRIPDPMSTRRSVPPARICAPGNSAMSRQASSRLAAR